MASKKVLAHSTIALPFGQAQGRGGSLPSGDNAVSPGIVPGIAENGQPDLLADLAFWMKARTLAWSFTPGLDSKPLLASTA